MKVVIPRDKALTVFCIIGYAWIVITIPSIFSPDTKRLGEWFPALFGAVVATQFISLIGVWHMKRWGVELFLFNFFFKFFVHFTAGMLTEWTVILGIVIGIAFAIVFVSHYKKMDRNL